MADAPIPIQLLATTTNNETIPGSPSPTPTEPVKRFFETRVALSTQLVISFTIGLAAFLAFCFLRYRWPRIFAPRMYSRLNRRVRLSKALFGWTIEIWNTSDSKILSMYGLDSLIFLRLIRILCQLFLFMAVVGLFVITPLKLFSPKESGDGAEKPTFWSHLTKAAFGSSQLLWMHLAFTYLYSAIVYVQLGRFAYEVLGLRWTYWLKIRRSLPARSVMVTGIPWEMSTENEVASYFRKYIGEVESVSILPHVGSLSSLIYRRAKLLELLEKRISWLIGNPCTAEGYDPKELKTRIFSCEESGVSLRSEISPFQRKRAFWCKSQANRWYLKTEKLLKLLIKIDQELIEKRHSAVISGNAIFNSDSHSDTRVGFVTFRSSASAQQAAQLVASAAPFQMQTTLAPEPFDVYWANVSFPVGVYFIRGFFALCIVGVLYAFWLSPIVYITAHLQPEYLIKKFPQLKDVFDQSPLLSGAFSYTIPFLILTGFNFCVPYLITWTSQYSGLRTNSSIQTKTLKQYHSFLLISVILVFTLIKGEYDFTKFVEDPGKFIHDLAQVLPDSAPFFMNYISFTGLGFLPLRLLRLDYFFSRLLAHTPRRLAQLHRPTQLNWSFLYPQPLLIFAIGMTYSTTAPLTSLLAFIYFGINYVVNKYLIMFVHTRPYESAGSVCLRILQQMPVGMLIYHILMLGVFITNNKYWCLLLMVPLLVFNVWLIAQWVYSYESHLDFVPLELLGEGEPRVSQVPPSPFANISMSNMAPSASTNSGGSISSHINMNTMRGRSGYIRCRGSPGGEEDQFGDRNDGDRPEGYTYSGLGSPLLEDRTSLQVDIPEHYSERQRLMMSSPDEMPLITPRPWYNRISDYPGMLIQRIWYSILRHIWSLIYVDTQGTPMKFGQQVHQADSSNSANSSNSGDDADDRMAHTSRSSSFDSIHTRTHMYNNDNDNSEHSEHSELNQDHELMYNSYNESLASCNSRKGHEASMNFIYGILDTSIETYKHPYIYGSLPSLWLPPSAQQN
ncbi:hypothetical protein H4219_003748 [Mycoemilia scoparia]|uniref:DUF221-domain-containing protein n=1 Tax=Mycoemilia scoparia TaxID=417184 RepID=A0A9W8DSI2_9FUNG|nr:hypothetical protein H4219_003748 [Mycoemilia scoparia]